ncbi:helix-turn-helix domain-containing protein [Sphingobacterium corticibacterium]|uniref:AraC family transcriptional regulator n=1 Tax=Sphingobacterium corticibacterium TaxID=2484746 RepID=A0A4Q6XHI0_9SPHI|nr:AraC family transcriptional regulator [Sphingobacterium corticibacterium]RZF59430.1 AraC family transcriptional regulator [Sphingobacterium corticibacterium]
MEMNTWEILSGEQIHTRILNKEWRNLPYNIIFELYLDPIGLGHDDYITLFLNWQIEHIAYNSLSYYLVLDKNLLRPETDIDILIDSEQPAAIKIHDLDQSYIFYLIKMLLKSSELSVSKLSRQFVRNVAEQLLLSVMINRITKEPETKLNPVNRYSLLAFDFVDRVKACFQKHKSVHYYAKKLGVTEKTLSKATQATLKITPKELIQKTLTEKAMTLLEHTDKSVKEISYELGIKETNNFSTFFKKMTNITPLEYRNLKRQLPTLLKKGSQDSQ